MDFEIGIACGECDSFSPMGADECTACGVMLSLNRPAAAARQSPVVRAQPAFDATHVSTPLSEEQLMDLARNYVCRECSTAVASGHKFCGTCGAAVPPDIVELRTKYFGTMQTPGKARLILIRGEGGVDGLSYMLQGTEHLAGREDGQILFPDDPWLSPRHANFFYDSEGRLVVRDEGSLNGIYIRIRERAPLAIGDAFLCGEQLFQLQPAPAETAGPAPDQTYFYASPRKPFSFSLVQLLANGGQGLVHCATGTSAQIGREDCDINFPADVYMSGQHARIEMGPDRSFSLMDAGSKNGTYLRITAPEVLKHGDYVFLGKELLRVEMTA
jgi:pSer/pThr/pTyr-binding forkhead associated (FHA) protein